MRRRKLYKSVWRDITTHKMQFLGIIIMVALGAGSLGTFVPSFFNMKDTYDNTYEHLKLADFRVSTVIQTDTMPLPVIQQIMDNLTTIYPIESYESRIVYEVSALQNSSNDLTLIAIRLVGINVTDGRHPSVNDVSVISGRWFVDSDNWNTSRSFNEYIGIADTKLATYHNLTPNTRFNLLADGDINRTTEMRVIGNVGTAEFLWLAASWQDLMPSSRRFGYMFMPLTSVQQLLGMGRNEVNDIAVRMIPGTSNEVRDGTMKALELALRNQGLNIMPPVPKENEPSYAALQFDIESLSEIVIIFPAFILLLAIFSTYVTMSRLVAAQRQAVGVTQAMGYSRRDIYRKYLLYGIIVGVIGGTLGILIGEIFSRLFTDLYLSMMVVPFRHYGFHPEIWVVNIFLSLGVCVLGCIIPARSSARMIPSVAMRDDPAEVVMGRIPLVEKVLKRIFGSEPRVRSKIILRNLFRNRRRTVSTLMGIAMSFILVSATAGANDSFSATIDTMALKEGWNVQVQFTNFKTESALNTALETIVAWPEVETAYRGITFSTVLTSNFSDIESILQIRIQDPSASVHTFQFSDAGGAFNDTGIVITQGTATKLDVGLGMNVTILHPRFNVTSLFPLTYKFEMVNSSVRVTGITQETTSLVCWLSFAVAENLIGQADLDANTVYIKLYEPTTENINAVKQKIFRHIIGVRSAVSVADIAQDMSEYMDLMKVFLALLIGFSMTLAASIVLTTTVINALERRRETATILTLGGSYSQSQRSFLIENLIVTTVGILIGTPLSYVALLELGSSFSTDFFTFVIAIEPFTILGAMLAILTASVVVQWLSIRGFRKMDLVQETKRRIAG